MIDEPTSKLVDMMSIIFDTISHDNLKRAQPDNEIDANILNPANKKPDHKQTPVKKSPPFGKAGKNQNP